jgi:hypothetical protein
MSQPAERNTEQLSQTREMPERLKAIADQAGSLVTSREAIERQLQALRAEATEVWRSSIGQTVECSAHDVTERHLSITYGPHRIYSQDSPVWTADGSLPQGEIRFGEYEIREVKWGRVYFVPADGDDTLIYNAGMDAFNFKPPQPAE